MGACYLSPITPISSSDNFENKINASTNDNKSTSILNAPPQFYSIVSQSQTSCINSKTFQSAHIKIVKANRPILSKLTKGNFKTVKIF